MGPPIFDSSTLYKIINVKFSNQAADLLDAVPKGPIAGFHLNNYSSNQSWYINQVDGCLNNIENGSVPSSFAYVEFEVPDAGLFGGSATLWCLDQVDAAKHTYRVMTADKKFVWALVNGSDRTQIVLKERSKYEHNTEAHWKIVAA